jgi:FAD/FMN-containing dehydrogenase
MPDSLTSTAALAAALRANIQGGSQGGSQSDVRFDPGARALYSTDGSNYRQVPIGVVLPHDNDDVLAAISICREFGAPLLCRGGGTSLAGQCCNVAVVLDFSRYMSRILEIDPARRIARVQPGVYSTLSATPPKNITSPSVPIPPATTAAPSAA